MTVLIFAICALATTIGALCGFGGGVIMKPVLDAFGIMSVQQVSFMSGCTVLAMSMVSVYKKFRAAGSTKDGKREKAFDTTSIVLAIGAAVGGIVGKKLFNYILQNSGNPVLTKQIQSATLLVLLAITFAYMLAGDRIRTLHVTNVAASGVIGFALGTMSSFLGIGGGPMNMMVLCYFFSMETKTAVQNSLFVVLASQICGIGLTIVEGRVPELSVFTLIVMMIGGVAGAQIGGIINKKISSGTVRVLLNLVIISMLIINFYNAFISA